MHHQDWRLLHAPLLMYVLLIMVSWCTYGVLINRPSHVAGISCLTAECKSHPGMIGLSHGGSGDGSGDLSPEL